MVGLAAKANEDRPMFGIGLMLLAYLAFSCIDTGAKWLALAGYPAQQTAFARYAGALAISLILIARGGLSPARFATKHKFLVVFRGLLLMGSTVLNFIAVKYLPLTLTSTILFSAPLIICALSGPLLGERVRFWRWSAILVGFAGIFIAVRPFGADFHPAALLSLCSAAGFALYSIITRKLAGVVAAGTMQLYVGVVGTAVLAPFAVATWQTPTAPLDWLPLATVGIFGWLGHELLTRAHGYAAASTLTPFTYSMILYLTVWSYLVFGDLPDIWTVAGAAIVVAAGLFIWLREKQLSAKRSLQPVAGQPSLTV